MKDGTSGDSPPFLGLSLGDVAEAHWDVGK